MSHQFDLSEVPLVILAGGEGSRYRNVVFDNPKVLAAIGGQPILWHIIKHFEFYGVKRVILCLGYEHKLITETISALFKNSAIDLECVFTGDQTPTGGRIKAIEKYIKSENFFVTYGDGLSSININDLFQFHRQHAMPVTISVVRRESPFGQVMIDEKGEVLNFQEKPILPFWINSGFMIFNKSVFSYLTPETILETMLFKDLAQTKSLMAYTHTGFWKSMDTVKEHIQLQEIWQKNEQEWEVRSHEDRETE